MSEQTMMAVRLHQFGGPAMLRYEVAPRPSIGPGEVLVRVRAACINPPDLYLRDGYRTMPPEWRPAPAFPMILGTDISGLVEAVADDVTGFAIGDEVYSMVRFPEDLATGSGAYAEFVNVPADELAIKPAGVDHSHAAGAPMSLLTAWQFLIDVGHDEPNPFQSFPHEPMPLEGRTVVVNGAAGGVGHLAVQLAKSQGATVIGVASSRNGRLLLELGADRFIDYVKTSVEEVVQGADLVVDAVGGDGMERLLTILKPGGALYLVNPLGFAGYSEAERMGVVVSSTQVHSSGAQLAEASRLLDDGTVRVVIGSAFPLAGASEAHERALRGGSRGKIVLEVG